LSEWPKLDESNATGCLVRTRFAKRLRVRRQPPPLSGRAPDQNGARAESIFGIAFS
jgi:hypothetical protein